MSVLPGQLIREIYPPIVSPFSERRVKNGMSYGLSVAGYDIRAAQDLILYPGDFVLASSMERFQMPNDVIGFVHDKSTWARRGIAVQNTVIEPGWSGYLTLEVTNHIKPRPFWKFWKTDVPIVVQLGDPIAQIVFHYTVGPVENPYNGKYQDQGYGPQPARDEIVGR